MRDVFPDWRGPTIRAIIPDLIILSTFSVIVLRMNSIAHTSQKLNVNTLRGYLGKGKISFICATAEIFKLAIDVYNPSICSLLFTK